MRPGVRMGEREIKRKRERMCERESREKIITSNREYIIIMTSKLNDYQMILQFDRMIVKS